MKVEIQNSDTCTAADMETGQLGILVSGDNDCIGHLMLRIYGRIASLNDPSCTWDVEGNTSTVKLLPPGTKVLLTQEEEQT